MAFGNNDLHKELGHIWPPRMTVPVMSLTSMGTGLQCTEDYMLQVAIHRAELVTIGFIKNVGCRALVSLESNFDCTWTHKLLLKCFDQAAAARSPRLVTAPG